MPNPKDHFSSAVLGGKIYAMGGEHGHDQLHQQQNDMWSYDPAVDTWTQLASMPIAKSHIEGGTFVLDGKIVMAGGQVDNFQPTANVITYDPSTNSWTTLAPLPAARQGAVVRAVGDAVYFTLGGTQTNSPQSATWRGALPAALSATAAELIAGSSVATSSLLADTTSTGRVTGGTIGHTLYTVESDGSVSAQDLASGAVRIVAAASAKPFAGGAGSVVVYKKKLIVFGGEDASAGKVQIFDTVKHRWKLGRAMPFLASGQQVKVIGHAVYLLSDQVDGQPSTLAAKYDLARGKWTRLADASKVPGE